MKLTYLLALPLLWISTAMAQTPNTNSDSTRAIVKRYYAGNQKKLDKTTSGIGVEESNVKFGSNYEPVHFDKVDVRVNIVEFKVGIGNSYYHSPFSAHVYNTQVSTWSFGVNYPISALGIGKANSTSGVRALPFISADFGRSSFKQYLNGDREQASSFHLSVAPGYRIKIPYLIIDLRMNVTWNNLTDTNYPNSSFVNNNNDFIKDKSFSNFSFTPSVGIIIDGLFSKFDPVHSEVSGEMAVYDNITEKKYYSGEAYNSSTGKTEKTGLYKTETTYEYHTEAISLPISDIGAYIGVGPRLLYRPVSDNSYRMPSLLGGVGVHGRIKVFSADINADKGKAGFASQANTNRTLITSDIAGKGTFDVTNVTANVGIDLGPLLLGLAGIITKRNGETPYFSISGGFIYGYSFLSGYHYHDKAVGDSYQAYFRANPDKSTVYNNAALNKSGVMHGLYFGLDVGAVGFRWEMNKYNNAPLARCGYYSISYKYPLLRSKRRPKN